MFNDQKDKLCNNSKSFQSNQQIPNPNHEGAGQPIVKTDRTEQPVFETHRKCARCFQTLFFLRKHKIHAVVNNQVTKQRGQRILGDHWQWEANGQSSEGDNWSLRHNVLSVQKWHSRIRLPNSFMQQSDRNASRTPNEVPEEKVPVVECLDGHAIVGRNRLWPNRLWPKPTLAKTDFGQNRL